MKLATSTQVEFALSRPSDIPFLSKELDSTATYSNAFGNLDLVNLAREILEQGSSEEAANQTHDASSASKMSTEEQGAGAQNESPTSRFTAVNGKEQPSPGAPANGMGSNGASRRGSDERSNGQPRISPPGQEKLTITTTTSQREDWPKPPSGDRHQYQPPSGYSEADMSHKRKRSGSIDQNSSSANSYHSHAIPSSTKQTPTTATTESDVPRDESLRAPSQSDQRDSYETGAQYRQFLANEEARDAGVQHDHWHSRQYSGQSHMTSDEQIGEALQRASQNMDAQQRGGYQSPGDDDRSANPYGNYGHDRREMSAGSDPKKRKRNFSNRTKTGCMTCRRRKKKCDENRPECEFHGIWASLGLRHVFIR